MALTYGVMFREGFSGKAYGIFLAKRLARVYPLYLILTVTFAGLAVMVGAQWVYGKNFAFVVAANLALVQAWGMAPSLTPAAWSISTEWAAYLLFPWLAIGVLHGRRTYVCIWAVICAGSIAALALNNSHFIRPNGPGGYGPLDVTRFDSLGPMVRCIASFSLGITAYRLRGVPSIRKWLENSNVSSLLCIITLGLACIPNADVFVVMTFPALVTSLSLHKSGISSFLSSKATYSLGLWSYSLYLVHLPFRPAQISLAATLSASIPWGASVLASVLILTVPDAIDGDLLRDREAVSNPAAIRSAPPCGQCIQHQMRVFLQVLCADGRPARLRTVPSPRSTGRSHINHASTWSNVGEGSDSDCSKQRTPDLPTLERKLSWSAECPCRSSRVMEQGQAHRAKATSCVASRVNSVTRQDQA